MMKRIIALLLALILTVGLLPTVALAAEGETGAANAPADVIDGYYDDNNKWTKGTITQQPVPGVQTVSKTAKPTSNPNEYEVKLEVVLKQTSETKTGAAATALVLDCSGSMGWCTVCGQESCRDITYNATYDVNEHGYAEYYVKEGENYVRVHYCDGRHWRSACSGGAGWYKGEYREDHTKDKKITPKTSETDNAGTQFYRGSNDTSRMTAAKNAAKNFLKTYSGFDASVINSDGTLNTTSDLSIKRYVAVIRFSEGIDNDQDRTYIGGHKDYKYDWFDVSTVDGYNKVLATINQARAGGGTNLDAGLTTANDLMNADLVKNLTSKNVIALTDGAPTYSKSYGDGGSTNQDICNETAKTAETLRVKSKVYTVCFAAESESLYDGGGTVGNFLKERIATQPAEGSNEKYAYNATSAEALIKVFKDITDTIVSGLNDGKVNDGLPNGITATDTTITSPMEWTLAKDFTLDKSETTENDKKVITYTYTKKYTVTIDPENVNLKKTADGYAPLNEETTLTVTVDGKEEKIPFPIPAGKVTPKEYTVKGIIDNNGTVNSAASPHTETVESGKTSTAMTFVPATGYVIDTITEKIGSTDVNITGSNAGKDSYTYAAKTVTADITVTVTTKKRTDLSYTVKYVDKDTNAEIRQSETTSNQQFEAEIDVASMDKLPITGYTYNSCSPTDKLTIGTGENLITLYYTKNKHNINYVYAAGSPQNAPSLDSYNELNVPFGTLKTRKGAPTLDGWTFNGWTTEDVEVAADGTFSMPDKDVTFTGSWTQRATATIAYVVVPNGGGTLSSYSETKYVDDKTAATGSSATPADGYRFVGWYAEEGCTTLLTAESHYTPTKTGDNWTGATYYAKFEAIPKPDADDLPTVTVQCTNGQASHQQSSGKPLVAGTYNTSAVSKDTATGKYTCTITLTDESGYITSYNTETNTTHVADSQNDVTAITMTYDETSKTWSASPANFVINVKCDTPTVNVTYEWTGLDNATFELAVEPKLPSTAKVTKGGKHTVDTNYKAGDIRVATNGDKYRFSGWSTTNATIDVNGEITNIQNNITLTGTWTKLGSGTFDLNNKIFKSFEKKQGSKDIPGDKDYIFEATVTRLDKENNNQKTSEEYTGTVTLNGATAAATPSFVFYNPITFHTGGKYRFLVEEKSNTVTALSSDERIDYDNAVYYLYVTVSDDLKTINYRFVPVVAITSAEEESAAAENQPITFYNYYYAAKEPGKYTIDFSNFIRKELTKTGDRSFNGAEFTANVDGWRVHKIEIAMVRASAGFGFEPLNSVSLKAAFPADITFEADGKAYRGFTGDTLTVTAGRYLFLIDEINDGQTNITYDESKYWLELSLVEDVNGNVSLVAQRIRKFVEDDTNESVLELDESEWKDVPVATIYPVCFYNTIDTGRDDYIPIIIPTIINKDTGMLNKTDHFAYVIGYPDGTVHPNGQITRAEVATIFFRLLRDEVRDGAFTTSNTYSDVAYGKWYNNPISTMSALGIITGYPDGTFKPNKPITRAEFAAIAARFDETQSGKSATFSDVIGHWAAKEIGIAYYNDWIKGYPDGTFKPDQNITRAEAMTLINRVLERKPESPADLLTNMNKWTDNMDTSKWYYLDVQEATNSHGYTRKTFNYELWRQMLPDPDWSRYER